MTRIFKKNRQKNIIHCIIISLVESCNNEETPDVDDSFDGTYFFPGGEATCPMADWSRSFFQINEISQNGWVMNVLVDGVSESSEFSNQARGHIEPTGKVRFEKYLCGYFWHILRLKI